MIRRQSIVAIAILAIACVSPAVAAGTRARGKGKPKPSTATTRTIVNSTSRSWYTYVFSGTGTEYAQTVGVANAQGAKVIAPGGKGVFNVKPLNGGATPYGDDVNIWAVPPLDVSNPSNNLPQPGGTNGNTTSYPSIPAGTNFTITITETSGTAQPDFNPQP
jgi:hypothetical protein